MTITEHQQYLKNYQPSTKSPFHFEMIWSAKWAKTSANTVKKEAVPYNNPMAVYETLDITQSDGMIVHGRYIRPVGDDKVPTILMFHDLGRGIRGWHHMTRFIALGYAVAAMENPIQELNLPESTNLASCYHSAMTFTKSILALPHTDVEHLLSWGEGFGGGLAVFTAAMVPQGCDCAVLNPMPADFHTAFPDLPQKSIEKLEYFDLSNFAPMLKKRLFLGCGQMDRIAPPAGQFAIYNRATCPKSCKFYPKYEHERINFFEDEFLKFLHY